MFERPPPLSLRAGTPQPMRFFVYGCVRPDQVAPRLGTRAYLERLVAEAHALVLKVRPRSWPIAYRREVGFIDVLTVVHLVDGWTSLSLSLIEVALDLATSPPSRASIRRGARARNRGPRGPKRARLQCDLRPPGATRIF